MLERLFEYVQSYVHGLPNFICDEVTRRYTNFAGVAADGNPRYKKRLRHSDTFTRSLRFVGGAEEGSVEEVNGKRGARAVTRQGQRISAGEFGGDIVIIFGADAKPEMHWGHWEMYGGRQRAVFSFFVGTPVSKFSLFNCCYQLPDGRELQQSYNAPVRGLVYLDPSAGTIARLLIRAVNLPPAFHIKESNTAIDYGGVSIGGQMYTLPLRAVTFGRTDTQFNRNEIAFVKYRKFEAESVLTFTHSKIIGYGAAPKK
ncbi:MAG TPA: hypothetical protein VHZ55_11475 [Bryobacteraceae bacterium]|jgi:hypothetical protein|nr:hypothetical protein [Bryobacteraceae bacterium]